MDSSEYYKEKLNRKLNQSDLQHQSIMNRLVECEEMNLFVMLKPGVTIDGNQYCFLYGDNLQVGIAGFGSTIM